MNNTKLSDSKSEHVTGFQLYTCRKLRKDDLKTVMHWRMLPYVTRYMNTDPILTIKDQICWYDKMLSSNDLYYWIVHVDNAPCGVINLNDVDNINKRCSWGYYVAEKKFRSLRLAISLEMSLYNYAFEILNLNKVVGKSFCINKTVIKLHELCGCKTEGVLRQHIYKNGQYYDVCIQSMILDDWKIIRNKVDYQSIEFSD